MATSNQTSELPSTSSPEYQAMLQRLPSVIIEESKLVQSMSGVLSHITKVNASDSPVRKLELDKLATKMKPVILDLHQVIQGQVDLLDQTGGVSCTPLATTHPSNLQFPPPATHQPSPPSTAIAPTAPSTRILFLGNPGTGKSTLINCLRGRADCKSGISFGDGMTKEASEHVSQDCVFVDTPGLADKEIEVTAAKAITGALKMGGACKLFFFVRLESGRIVSDDLVTIQRVLDTIGRDDLMGNFSVIVNNLTPKAYQTMQEQGEAFQQVTALINSGKYNTCRLLFIPRLDALVEQDDAVTALPEHVVEFIRDAPVVHLEPNQIAAIDTSDYRAMAESLRNGLEALRRDKTAQQQKIAELHQRFQGAPPAFFQGSRHDVMMRISDYDHDVEMRNSSYELEPHHDTHRRTQYQRRQESIGSDARAVQVHQAVSITRSTNPANLRTSSQRRDDNKAGDQRNKRCPTRS